MEALWMPKHQHNEFEMTDPRFAPMFALLAQVQPDIGARMLALYRDVLEDPLDGLERALARGELEAIQAIAHKLAGSAAMMQDAAVARPARAIDDAVRAGALGEAQALWPVLRDAAQATRRALNKAYPGA